MRRIAHAVRQFQKHKSRGHNVDLCNSRKPLHCPLMTRITFAKQRQEEVRVSE
jgi:hypothetical protein